MSHHTALLDQFAQFLATNEVGVYNPDGVFVASQRGIVISAFPEVPAELVSVSFYMPEYQRLQGGTRRLTASRIQIRTRLRGHPLATLDLFDHLSHLIDRKLLQLGPITAHGAFLSATEPLATKAGAWVQASNWTLTALEGLPTP